jgi:hypothetical protein
MNKLYTWLSGVFTTCAVVHLTRVLLKIRLDVNLHRVPLKVSAIIGLITLILAVVLYAMGNKSSKK